MPILDFIEFGLTTLIQMFELRVNLISALIERWCLKTHIFHLLCREYTITLEDVALQIGLPVDYYVVMGSSKVLEPASLFMTYLDARLGMVKLDLRV